MNPRAAPSLAGHYFRVIPFAADDILVQMIFLRHSILVGHYSWWMIYSLDIILVRHDCCQILFLGDAILGRYHSWEILFVRDTIIGRHYCCGIRIVGDTIVARYYVWETRLV